jgi:hypothetical protein
VDWLKGEFDTNDTDRIGRVIATPEYALWTLSELSSNCVSLFDTLSRSIESNSLFELYAWTKTLSCYDSSSATLEYLRQAGLSNGRADGPFHTMHWSLYHQYVTGELANEILRENLK